MLEFEIGVGPAKLEKGQIRYCSLDGIAESQFAKLLGKRRPCIIFQANEYNCLDYTIGILPLSSTPIYVSENDELLKVILVDEVCGAHECYVCLNRMIFIDQHRIGNFVGETPDLLIQILNNYFTKRLGLNSTKEKEEVTE